MQNLQKTMKHTVSVGFSLFVQWFRWIFGSASSGDKANRGKLKKHNKPTQIHEIELMFVF